MWRRNLDPEYSRIKNTLRKTEAVGDAVIKKARRRISEIVDKSFVVRSFMAARVIVGVLLCIGGLSLTFYFGFWGFVSSAIAVALFLSASTEWMRRVRQGAAQRLTTELEPHETAISMAESLLRAAETRYERECELYDSYPPDWDIRRKAVKARDGYCCSSCGWPGGVQRKRRELHVHHVISLTRGGDNSLNNLTTLCHMCHRRIDGDHRGVRSSRERKRRPAEGSQYD